MRGGHRAGRRGSWPRRRAGGLALAAGLALVAAGATLAGCGQPGGSHAAAHHAASAALMPSHILNAPKNLMGATRPQADGSMWLLAGGPSAGLFQVSSATGKIAASASVSADARSVAQARSGVIGLALGTATSGALELLSGQTPRVTRTVPLPAPARQIVISADGGTFYVLTAWHSTASVVTVNPRTGAAGRSIPVPGDTVAATPDVPQTDLYVLERSGLVDEIAVRTGKITATFRVGTAGRALALSPDGRTLYVLKGRASAPNVAVVSLSTESVHLVLPAPSHCHSLLVTADGGQLYEVVGTPSYGNIQVFAV
jgi:hypothetical protein